MSAYLVSDKSLSVIAKSLEYYANKKPRYSQHTEVWELLNNYHDNWFTQPAYGQTEIKMAEKLFYKLLEINLLSLGERYNDIKSWEEQGKKYEYDPKAPAITIPTLIDLLDNWRYQACEGVGNETDFYKLTGALQDKLAREYVRLSKSEDEKAWGIDDYAELEKIRGIYAY